MAKKGKGSKIPWTPILLIGGLGVAYWQRDKIMPIINDLKGKAGLYGRANYANVIPYFNITPGVGQGQRGSAYDPYQKYQQMPYSVVGTSKNWYPYHRTHWSQYARRY